MLNLYFHKRFLGISPNAKPQIVFDKGKEAFDGLSMFKIFIFSWVEHGDELLQVHCHQWAET